ncbi:MAG: hypothetical protein ABSA66_15715 [Roseiarcus sp.]|jgi:hypothetical protein
MLSDAALADLAGRSYRGPWSGRVALDCEYDLLPRADELVVVMPGTHPDDPLDWLRDLSAAPRWVKGVGPLHAGFGEGGEALFQRVSEATAAETRPLTFAGHSLGGALAQALAAVFAARAPGRKFRVVTFGAPRVGFLNPWFSHLVRRGLGSIEYARGGDIVPDVPSRPPFNHPTWRRAIGAAVPGTPEALSAFIDIAKIGRAICDNHSIQRYAADLAALGL